jgi:tripartite ATP-independent transporter DctM subunit
VEARKTETLSRPASLLARSEDFLVCLAIALIIILPLGESLFRKAFDLGIPGSIMFVQHLVLYVAMLGSAVAARQSKLLTLSSLTRYLKGVWRATAQIYANAFATMVTIFLLIGSLHFILAKRASEDLLIGALPLWPVLLVLPVGFTLVAYRLWLAASSTWGGRTLAAALVLLLLGVGVQNVVPPETLAIPALFALLLAIVLGAPIFTAIGGAALILFWSSGQPIAMIAINQYRLTVEPTLPMIPLFTLVGYLLAEGNASRRLVTLFDALFGAVRGGPAIAAAVVCALFTAFTGASGVTILALGGLLMPVLLEARYSESRALGFITGAGSLGLLFPPSLPVILYAVMATQVGTEISVRQMFLGGLLPGLLLLAMVVGWGIISDERGATKAARLVRPEDGTARTPAIPLRSAFWAAKWELLVPVVALIALFSGLATQVEAAAITVLYTLVIQVVVHRDLGIFREVPKVMVECSLLVGGVLLILGVAMGFSDYLLTANVPELMVEWARQFIHSQWAMILCLNLLLLVVGCIMDIYSAIVVVAPLIIPIGVEFGMDPIHLGIIFLTNLELGFLTPPVGINLFLSSYRFNKPMPEVIRSVLPLIAILLVGVLLVSYVPWLSTFLPELLGDSM